MTTSSSPIFLPLSFNQLFELANQLPTLQKKIANLLLNEATKKESNINVTAEQKKFVSNSIKKHKENPQLLVDENEAWKQIG
jgi:hypothetical protein